MATYNACRVVRGSKHRRELWSGVIKEGAVVYGDGAHRRWMTDKHSISWEAPWLAKGDTMNQPGPGVMYHDEHNDKDQFEAPKNVLKLAEYLRTAWSQYCNNAGSYSNGPGYVLGREAC